MTDHIYDTFRQFDDPEIERRARMEVAIILGLAFECSLDDDPDTWPVGLRSTWDKYIASGRCNPRQTFGKSAEDFVLWRLDEIRRLHYPAGTWEAKGALQCKTSTVADEARS